MESVRTRLGIVGKDFTVRVTAGEGEARTAPVEHLRARAVVVRAVSGCAPWPLGTKVSLVFEGGGLLHGYETTGRVDGWQEDASGRVYLFTPSDPEVFELEFVEPFHRGGLRRRSARASPDPNCMPDVWVSATPQGAFVKARAADLSIDGMRLFVNQRQGAALAAAGRLWVRLKPPGETIALMLEGEVRHAHVVADQFAFGVRIEHGRSSEAARAETMLTAYVMRLQQQLLAVRCERPAGFEEMPEE